MCGYIDVEDSTCRVFHNDKDIELVKGRRDHDTEVTRDDRLGMVAHKRQPALRREVLIRTAVWTRGCVLRL
jgi:hypothetical protein